MKSRILLTDAIIFYSSVFLASDLPFGPFAQSSKRTARAGDRSGQWLTLVPRSSCYPRGYPGVLEQVQWSSEVLLEWFVSIKECDRFYPFVKMFDEFERHFLHGFQIFLNFCHRYLQYMYVYWCIPLQSENTKTDTKVLTKYEFIFSVNIKGTSFLCITLHMLLNSNF